MDLYLHIRIVFGMVIGLAVTHLLGGIALIVQYPKRYKMYWVHLLWVAYLFLYLLAYWWWEFNLASVPKWTFGMYAFVACYAVLLYLLCVLIFPSKMEDYDGFRDYYYSRGHWFFALLTIMYLVDLGDTLIKGKEYYGARLMTFTVRAAVYVVLCLIAARSKRPRFHAFFAIFAIAFEAAFIYVNYRTLF